MIYSSKFISIVLPDEKVGITAHYETCDVQCVMADSNLNSHLSLILVHWFEPGLRVQAINNSAIHHPNAIGTWK